MIHPVASFLAEHLLEERPAFRTLRRGALEISFAAPKYNEVTNALKISFATPKFDEATSASEKTRTPMIGISLIDPHFTLSAPRGES